MRGGAADLEVTVMTSTAAAVGPASGNGRLLAAAGLDRAAARCGLRRHVIWL